MRGPTIAAKHFCECHTVCSIRYNVQGTIPNSSDEPLNTMAMEFPITLFAPFPRDTNVLTNVATRDVLTVSWLDVLTWKHSWLDVLIWKYSWLDVLTWTYSWLDVLTWKHSWLDVLTWNHSWLDVLTWKYSWLDVLTWKHSWWNVLTWKYMQNLVLPLVLR